MQLGHKTPAVRFCFRELSGINKSAETERKVEAGRGCTGAVGSNYQIGRVPFRGTTNFLELEAGVGCTTP